MGIEIEHKYLVKNDSYRSMATSRVRMVQGYLCREPQTTVRVRIKGGKGYLTVKGITMGDTRQEFEYEVPLTDAEQMLRLCPGRVIEKVRWHVPFEGHLWEVDEFEGELTGLVTAEVELPDSQTRYAIPPFVGEDVTGDARYFNSAL